MKLHHLTDVHAVDMVCSKDRYDIRFELLDEVDVLIDRVRRPLVPGLSGTHLCRDRGNKILIRWETTKPPPRL